METGMDISQGSQHAQETPAPVTMGHRSPPPATPSGRKGAPVRAEGCAGAAEEESLENLLAQMEKKKEALNKRLDVGGNFHAIWLLRIFVRRSRRFWWLFG